MLRLSYLRFAGCNFSCVPAALASLPSLETLVFDCTPPTAEGRGSPPAARDSLTLHPHLTRLTGLRALKMYGCSLAQLPPPIRSMTVRGASADHSFSFLPVPLPPEGLGVGRGSCARGRGPETACHATAGHANAKSDARQTRLPQGLTCLELDESELWCDRCDVECGGMSTLLPGGYDMIVDPALLKDLPQLKASPKGAVCRALPFSPPAMPQCY